MHSRVILIMLICLLAIWARGQSGSNTVTSVALDWSNPSINSQVLYWYQWTNGPVKRYQWFWTNRTNSDTGTNYQTTTNWFCFADVNSSTTNAPLTWVPTNSYMTLIIATSGGRHTVPMPVITNNTAGDVIVNYQPAAP